MADSDDIFFSDEGDPDDRFDVLSTVIGEPGEVMQWCETGTFRKAEAVFQLLEPHCKRLGYANLALQDRWTDQIIRSAD